MGFNSKYTGVQVEELLGKIPTANDIWHKGNLTKLSQLENDSCFITSNSSITGNAGSASKLKTARTIWGQSFDGSSDVSGEAMGLGGFIDFQAGGEINRYGGTLYLQHRGDGSKTGTGEGVTGNIVMCYNGGNVGIGIFNPAYKLHINGTLNATSIKENGTDISSTYIKKDSTTATTGEYIYAQDASGNTIRISKTDLASVITNVMKNNGYFPFDYRGQVSDVNNAVKAGSYIATPNAANSPSYYCSILVIVTGDYITQYAKELTAAGLFFVRTCIENTWSSWTRCDNVQN